MDTNDYRRKIEATIAKAQAHPPRSLPRVTALQSRALLSDKKTSASRRTEALGQVLSDEGPDGIPKAALERLADPTESPRVRLESIRLLQHQQFLSAAASGWRAAFIAALRGAVEDKVVRPAALEVLSLAKDRPTQERLLEGLRQPRRALVPVDQALRLLSNDIHADVIEIARTLIRRPEIRKNKAASIQATRILAGDPQSVSTLEQVLSNGAYSIDTRRVAATALSHLSPDRLDAYADAATVAPRTVARSASKKAGGLAAKRMAARPRAAAPTGALAQHIRTLQRVRR